jgi:hypothetical protein
MSHELSPELARKVAERAFESYREKYADFSPTLTWISPTSAKATFSAKGVSLHGTVELAPGKIMLDLDVPFVFRLFKDKAMAVLDRELSHWHERARKGEFS